MKLKLDESLGQRGRQMIAAAGHDVASVADQGLEGSLDGDLLEYCRAEGRCLVTLDLEFANPLVFLPSRYPGIAVLRIPQKASATDLLMLIETLMEALKSEVLIGKLWIVEIGRIRVYEEESACPSHPANGALAIQDVSALTRPTAHRLRTLSRVKPRLRRRSQIAQRTAPH